MHHLLLLTAALIGQPPDLPKGILVIVGGGPTTPEIVKKTLALAGGNKARVLIIPQASFKTNAGQGSVQMWRTAGAKKVTLLEMSTDDRNRFVIKDKKAALDAIKEADLIWMPGGSQSRLMQALTQAGLAKAIVDRFKEGATIGGTSAGAAIMSKYMLIGGESNMDCLTAGAIKTAEGLGLCPEVIVDQHFQRKDRYARLFLAVLTHPQCVGIGIYEGTAVVLHGPLCEVFGKSSAIIIDARKARKIPSNGGEPEAAANLTLHVLKAGVRFDLLKGVVLPAPTTTTVRQTVNPK
jgi:cyanophycinase